MKIKNVLFDLDGTISDSSEGITTSICHALKELGVDHPEPKELFWCIGPPLKGSFEKLLGTKDEKRVNEAIEIFRVRYKKKGMFENTLYDGMRDVLEMLNKKGIRLFVASAKYRDFCKDIINFFKLNDVFEEVYGSELDGTRLDKGELIKYILDEHKLRCSDTLMVGDREQDVAAANLNGVLSMGVTYGFGSREELVRGSADFISNDPKDILNYIN
jgi:phosphoglycolate phosphatase